jgi:hypothetical protein
MQFGIRQTGHHRAHVAERHQLVLAHRDGGDRGEDAPGIDAMQIDGLR